MKIVSFYCDIDGTNFYSENAIRLIDNCKKLKIDYYIVNKNYGNSWIDNVRAKPIFLLNMMENLKEDFIWLDVDCNILKVIDYTIIKDWGVLLRDDNNPHDFVHIIKYNQRNKDFLQKWKEEIDKIKKGSHTAFINIYKELNYEVIKPNYFQLGISDIESKNKYFNEKF